MVSVEAHGGSLHIWELRGDAGLQGLILTSGALSLQPP